MINKLFVLITFLVLVSFFSCSSDSSNIRNDVIALERDSLISGANTYLNEPVKTVTDASCERSAGGPHDYFSEGTYWWPDSTNPNSPYVRRDGFTNPNNFTIHRDLLYRLDKIVPTLVAAYLITNDKKYVSAAKMHLLGWFVNPKTKMNPNMLFAQAIHGRVTGRGIGIIDAMDLIEVAKSCDVLKHEGELSGKELNEIQNWFREFTTWLTTHKYGIDERDHGNNHSTVWALQVATYSKFIGDTANITFCRNLYKNFLLPRQMRADGSFPQELSRTRPYAYSLLNLEAMAALCQIASTKDDNLWNYIYQDSLGIQKAIDFMFPYIKDKSKWPDKPDVTGFRQWPRRQNSLLFAYMAYGDKKYYDLWKSLYKESNSQKLRSSVFVHEPLLWLE